MTMLRAAVATLALALAGCGFQLRGTAELSPRMATPYVDVPDRYTPFNAALESALRASGATPSRSREAASAVVRIHRDEVGRHVLSVTAQNTPAEYEVYYTVEYSVSANGEELLPPQSLTLTREYSYDETEVLAKQHEERLIREALARDLAGLVLRRLAVL
ncbi:MAG: LPS assembly lipoprotein LptE [Steroidobacteraceae bacterium]|jgi:LPS-assembly lipoprotein|nr:LPS assembly lipoprotein LptE [Steroidobacteraceae bacterium]